MVKKYAPALLFSRGERYLPCNLFFAGDNIASNREEYEKLTEDQKLGELYCYYHVAEGQRYTVCQYWYYYAYNEYALPVPLFRDDHEHDFECFKVFVDKQEDQPKIITCNIHQFREVTPVEGEIPKIKVEKGGHGLFTKDKRWRWSRGLEFRIQPSKSCEELRERMMPSARRLMDKRFKLLGNDYDWARIGRLAGPQVPWARWEYYLPEETLYGLDRKPEVDLSGIRGIDRSVTYMELVEIMRSRPQNLIEQREEIIERTRKQMTFGAVSARSRRRIVQALSDPKVKIPRAMEHPVIKLTGPILLPQAAHDLQEAVTLGRQYGVVTKKQYKNLRYAGVPLKEEGELKHQPWRIQSGN